MPNHKKPPEEKLYAVCGCVHGWAKDVIVRLAGKDKVNVATKVREIIEEYLVEKKLVGENWKDPNQKELFK